ncbi:gluconate 2-dehydrogenase subunit 3 family protein [Roseovarius arcticus]|uniref:gluconate 2-dehydrogenase subunit 3 family protein n=1 Tax=Roseovarius arcticus TaxID=2547404 RepID=UPI001FE9B541|nr:gluconate 2-dehydrogenase subunit 3 family protein [Roseovarius arcticus]
MASGLAGTALVSLARPVFGQATVPALTDYIPTAFSAEEWAFVQAATSRLIPSEGEGPGAAEARVAVFIDRQLADDFGTAADWYMKGPHDPGADPLLGFQSSLSPAQIYRDGIKAFDDWCRENKGAAFAELDPVAQDASLTALDGGEVNLPDALRDFFDVLLQNTKEGYFSDPRYGGNHGMSGWVHIGFPGARASFLEWNDPAMDNVAYPLGPVSIAGERT